MSTSVTPVASAPVKHNLLSLWKDNDSKPSQTRLIASAIVAAALYVVIRSVRIGVDIPPNVSALLEFLVSSALALLGVNTVGNRLVTHKYGALLKTVTPSVIKDPVEDQKDADEATEDESSDDNDDEDQPSCGPAKMTLGDLEKATKGKT